MTSYNTKSVTHLSPFQLLSAAHYMLSPLLPPLLPLLLSPLPSPLLSPLSSLSPPLFPPPLPSPLPSPLSMVAKRLKNLPSLLPLLSPRCEAGRSRCECSRAPRAVCNSDIKCRHSSQHEQRELRTHVTVCTHVRMYCRGLSGWVNES